MLVHSKTADYGETNITLPCVSNGEIKIAFNGKYMLDFVAITKGETFCMDFKTEGEDKEPKSIRINEEGHYEGLLMPIRIKEEVYS
jgi:DNA polymerase III sliding clamp (beta) subunit (PCNA family)